MKWFAEIFFPSLVERYTRQGKFKLSEKQADICMKYMKATDHTDFCQEFEGFGIYQVSYSRKNRLHWKNGFWFQKLY